MAVITSRLRDEGGTLLPPRDGTAASTSFAPGPRGAADAVAAAGRPVIFIRSRAGELERIVNEEGIGFAVPPSRPGELKQRILQLAASPQLCRIMGQRARATFKRRRDKPIAIERWAELLSAEIGTLWVPAAPARAEHWTAAE